MPQINSAAESLRNELSISEAEIIKFYLNLNRVDCKLKNGRTITADINYPFVSQDMKIEVIPTGNKETDMEGNDIIIPKDPISVNVFCSIFNDEKNYYVLGYTDKEYHNQSSEGRKGSIELSVGNNKIVINEYYINIQSENLILNGVKFKSEEEE